MTPLENVRVLEVSEAMAGPYCAMLLGDFGDDVCLPQVPSDASFLLSSAGGSYFSILALSGRRRTSTLSTRRRSEPVYNPSSFRSQKVNLS